MKTLAAVLIMICGAVAQGADFYYNLAAAHAPVIFHEVGDTPKADVMTRFDFDGDWVGNNNWNNLKKYPAPAHVYYDVRETDSHYFIFYGLFHPRDYAWLCLPWLCHENDLEGMLVVVRKDRSLNGTAVYFQAQAHTSINTFENLSGAFNGRVNVFVEKEGHGIYGWNPVEKKKWKKSETSLLFSQEEALTEARTKKYEKNWLVFHYGGFADDPEGSSKGIYRYELLPIWDHFWLRRDQRGSGKMFYKSFDFKGERYQMADLPAALGGDRYCKGCASAPWAWYDHGDGNSRGQWFFDPAFALYKQIKQVPLGYSFYYFFNPYVQ